MTYLASYKIGTASSDLVNVESLVIGIHPLRPPKSTYAPFTEYLDAGDGSRKGMGWAEAEWRWGFLTQAQRDALRDYCTGASATVYIQTRVNENTDEYAYLTGTMIWPEGAEDKDAGRRPDFTIRFRNLITFASS